MTIGRLLFFVFFVCARLEAVVYGVRPPPEAQPLIDEALREMGRSVLPRETKVDEDNARRRGLDDVGDARDTSREETSSSSSSSIDGDTPPPPPPTSI